MSMDDFHEENCSFSALEKKEVPTDGWTDGPTNQATDRPTDTPHLDASRNENADLIHGTAKCTHEGFING